MSKIHYEAWMMGINIFDSLQIFIERHLLLKTVCLRLVIQGAAKGLHAITKNEKPGINGQVVPRSLIKNILGNLNIRRFAFYQNQGFQVRPMNKYIVSSFQSVHYHPFLYCCQRSGKTPVIDQKMQNMLANPLFRCQLNIFSPDYVENF